MSDSQNDLISRTIRFLNQQKEMYGDFSVKADNVLATEAQKHGSVVEGVEVGTVTHKPDSEKSEFATETLKHQKDLESIK
jgi:hypothetical protein